jgi:hypothetical protein
MLVSLGATKLMADRLMQDLPQHRTASGDRLLRWRRRGRYQACDRATQRAAAVASRAKRSDLSGGPHRGWVSGTRRHLTNAPRGAPARRGVGAHGAP